MTVVMKDSQRKVLVFPKPSEERGNSMLVQIGNDRFAIRWEIEELPPAAPLVPWKRAAQKAKTKTMK